MGNSHDLYPESTGAQLCSVCGEWITGAISFSVDNKILCPKCYRELSGLPLLPGGETFTGPGFPRKSGARIREIEAAFHEGYREGYSNGELHADGYERGHIITEVERVKVEGEAWEDSEAKEGLPSFPREGGAWLTLKELKALDTWHGTDGIEIGLCPVCAGKGHHKEGCWLAEKIRQAEGGKHDVVK